MAVGENQPVETEFRITRDPRSRDIYYGGENIGSLRRDEGSSFKVVLGSDYDPHDAIPIQMLEAVTREVHSIGQEHLDPYRLLRRTARDLIFERTGMPGHPGCTDRFLIDAVRREVGLSPAQPWNEWSSNPFRDFRDNLIATIQEAGVEIKEPTTEVGHIAEALVTVLFH